MLQKTLTFILSALIYGVAFALLEWAFDFFSHNTYDAYKYLVEGAMFGVTMTGFWMFIDARKQKQKKD